MTYSFLLNVLSSDTAKAKERSIRLVATVQTLVQLAKIRPKLLVPHVMTLQPYLATKCDVSIQDKRIEKTYFFNFTVVKVIVKFLAVKSILQTFFKCFLFGICARL